MTGTILKGIGGFYYVLAQDGQIYTLHAQSKIRRKKLKPFVGDNVEFEPGGEGEEGWLKAILPRRTELKRPPVANIDVLVIVVSASKPEADLLLADRLLIYAQKNRLRSVIVANKADEDDANAERICAQYLMSGFHAFKVSARTGAGLELLKNELSSSVHAFAGQSGVGKSSLVNALYKVDLEVGDISDRIERGRHTTRECCLIPVENSGAVLDTPGFSLLENDIMDPASLKDIYPEFSPYRSLCRFEGCAHISEPDCAVKEALAQGKLDLGRYERYQLLYQEMKERWSKRYD
ncbi:MAG: ribosome small subunit-dependent GTPase A [Clostridiales bacterium]|nr:ribosome small subunit-dependent GTPase A [Clostridiales bacterium]